MLLPAICSTENHPDIRLNSLCPGKGKEMTLKGMIEMTWTKQDYPASMKNLPAGTREKAIEIANALIDDGYEEGRAIPIALSQAEKWADNDTPKDEYHLLSDDAGWMLKKDGNDRSSFRFETKQEVLTKGRELVKENNSALIIHFKDGSIESKIND